MPINLTPTNSNELYNLQRKVDAYKEVLQNTINYRIVWEDSLKDFIKGQLSYLVEATGLDAEIKEREEIENLEAIVLTLGTVRSGMFHDIGNGIERHLIKHNGALIYQQLFNGKVMVMLQYPLIETYGDPSPPKTIAIYRPEELKEPFFVRHLETLLQEVTLWEDYDDDAPSQQKIGFNLNFDGK